MALSAGEVLDDRYRLLAPLGEGGQGAVWRAADLLRPGADVALKLLRVPEARPVDMDRLRREAHALADLTHPSLIACKRLFEDLQRGVLGLVLELVEGSPLSSARMDPRFTATHAAAVLRHVADALAYVHAAGVVHRDVKPDNVLVGAAFFARPADPSTVKLADLGIAAPTGNPHPLTDAGVVVGTAAYLAPELIDPVQWPASPHGPGRDVFAFGVMAMELLRGAHPTGLLPGAGLARYAVAYRAFAGRTGAFPPGVEGDPWEPVFRGCLALRAAERVADGRAVVALLGAVRQPSSLPPTRTEPISHGAMRLSAPVVSRTLPEREERPAASVLRPPEGAPRSAVARRAWLWGSAAAIPLAFLIAFAAKQNPDEAEDEPPPISFGPPPALTAPVVIPAPTPPARTPADLPDTSCPAGMAPVPSGAGSFCLDRAPVTAAELAREIRPFDTASWPGATAEAMVDQSRYCNGTRPGRARHPANCVDWESSRSYCEKRGKRLPRPHEWEAAASRPDAARAGCQPHEGTCPISAASPGAAVVDLGGNVFEWTSDSKPGTMYAFTCGPSWRFPGAHGCANMNPREARNPDLGFRCAADPR